jgi:chorismate mutase
MIRLTQYAEGYDHVLCRQCNQRMDYVSTVGRVKWHKYVIDFIEEHDKLCKAAWDSNGDST